MSSPLFFDDPGAAPIDLTPDSVAKYLKVSGWDLVRANSGVQEVWRSAALEASVMLPLDQTFRDFSLRMREALDTIGNVHGLRGQALALEVASATSDILLLRADQYSSDGSIPLKEAEALLLGARKMLTAAALASTARKANFGPARPAAVRNFIDDDVRMGHTLRGSFVITILARLDDDPQPKSETEDGAGTPKSDAAVKPNAEPAEIESFSRRVMTTLASGLSAASEVVGVRSSSSSKSRDQIIDAGVSAQLLDSIMDMSGFDGVRAIETRFRWSPSHPEPAGVPGLIRLEQLDREQVKGLRDEFKKRPIVADDQVLGPVVRLERGEDEAEGVVVVEGFVGKVRKKVRVKLAPSKYAVATSAHDTRRQVVAEGDITFESGAHWMKSPRRFDMI